MGRYQSQPAGTRYHVWALAAFPRTRLIELQTTITMRRLAGLRSGFVITFALSQIHAPSVYLPLNTYFPSVSLPLLTLTPQFAVEEVPYQPSNQPIRRRPLHHLLCQHVSLLIPYQAQPVPHLPFFNILSFYFPIRLRRTPFSSSLHVIPNLPRTPPGCAGHEVVLTVGLSL